MSSREVIVGVGVIALVILGLTLHEWAHAAAATLRGDDTAKREGRLSVNPIRHIDPVMTLLVPFLTYFVLPRFTGMPPIVFGGARPVPIVPSRLRRPYPDMALCAAAGPATNFVLAFACLAADEVLRSASGLTAASAASEILRKGAFFNLLLALFNLVPIPPLDGSRIVAAVLPGPLREPYLWIGRFGILLVLVLIFAVPEAGNWIFQRVSNLYDWTEGTVRYGLDAVGVPLLKGK